MKRINWTPELDAKVLAARDNRVSAAALGDELGIGTNTICDRAIVLGNRFVKPQAWTAKEISALKARWTEGLTGSEIGILLGKSRNSVIGKVHRLGLEYRGPTSGTKKADQRPKGAKRIRPVKPAKVMINPLNKYAPKATPPTFYAAAKLIVTKPPISIGELAATTCRAIVGTGADGLATYCGDMTFHGKPFCEGHCALYYQPSDYRSRTRRRA